MSGKKKTAATAGKRSSLARARLTAEQQAEHDAKVGLKKVVSFRLTTADHDAYLAKVAASGMKPSPFFRDCVLTNKTQILARPKPSKELGRLVYLVNKASNNVNQLAHRANADYLAGTVSEGTYTRILGELQTLIQFMKAAVKNAD